MNTETQNLKEELAGGLKFENVGLLICQCADRSSPVVSLRLWRKIEECGRVLRNQRIGD